MTDGNRQSVPFIDHIPKRSTPISIGYEPQWGCVFHGQSLQGTTVFLPAQPPEVCDGLDNDGDGLVDEFCDSCQSNNLSGGQPIDFSTGNADHEVKVFETKLPGIGLNFNIYYNSRIINGGILGTAWSHKYESLLIVYRNNSRVMIQDNNGKYIYFISNDGGITWNPAKGNHSSLTKNTNEYILTLPDGFKKYYNLSGQITKIEDRYSNYLQFTYNDIGKLVSISDNFGKSITFSYFSRIDDAHLYQEGKLEKVTDPKGSVYEFRYWGEEDAIHQKGNLKSLIFPDNDSDPNNNPEYRFYYKEYLTAPDNYGIGITYAGDSTNLTKMTRIENGVETDLYIWSYYSTSPGPYDVAYQSGMYGGVSGGVKVRANWVSVWYDTPTHSHILDSLNRRTDYDFQVIGNEEISTISGPGCSSCGQGNTTSKYDKTTGNLKEKIDPNGNITKYLNYDSLGNAGEIVDAYGTSNQRSTFYTYNQFNQITSIRKPSLSGGSNEKLTTSNYDANGNLTSVVETGYSGGSSYSYTTTYQYNSRGQVTQIDGPRTDVSDITTFTYSQTTGFLLSETKPLVGTTPYSNYDANGNVGTVTDPNGNSKNFTYDARGRVKTVTDAVTSSTTTYSYDILGNIINTTLPENNQVTYAYDGANRLAAITDGVGNTINYTYDKESNKTSETIKDNLGATKKFLSYEYDNFNRVKKIINPDTTYTEFGYDNNGNMTSQIDANNKTTTNSYDALNRLASVTQPGSLTTSYIYDAHDNLTQVTDARGNSTTYTYDDMGRLLSTTSPDTGDVTYSYDSAGNMISKTDANNITTTYVYDALNRLTNINFSDSSQNISYTYDNTHINGKGTLTGVSDPSGTTVYYHDSLGRITKEEKVINSKLYTTNYTYDKNGMVTRIDYPSGRYATYTYDDTDRVTGLTMNGLTGAGSKQYSVSNIAYEPFGGMKSYQYSNGVTTTVNRDNQYRITGINTGTDQIMSRTYSFDNVGNILGITDSLNSQKNQTFGYDNLYRLTTANGIWGSGSFTYDNVGNRLSKIVGSNTTNYSYITGKNRLSSSTGAESATYSYDNNGNITSDNTLTFQYNQNNRLKLITGTGVNQTNSYDGLGKRVRVVSDTNRDFLYDISGNLVSEDNGSSATDYVYLNGIPVIKVEESNPSPSLCWDFETSGSCNTNLWDKGGIGYDYTTITRDSTHVISGQNAEKMIAEDTGTINSGLLGLTKTQIETTHRYLDLWVYSNAAQNFEVKVEVTYGSECGQTELVTILPYTNAVAGWNHVSADLLSVVNYVEQLRGSYLDLQIRVYNWLGNAIWVDNVSIHQYLIGEEGYFIHADHLGTPQVMTDSSKAIVWQADYMPFGDIHQQTGTATLNFRFPGQYKDLSNLYQNGFRDYNPKIGRYVEGDPIGQLSDVNLYTYVGNNPVKWVDPFGLYQMCHRDLQLSIPYARHCYARYEDGTTSSYGPEGVHPDPDPNQKGTVCTDPKEPEKDDCIERAMQQCLGSDYSFTGFNCCHCVEQALKECNTSIPPSSWPNWPFNPGPQPGEPGYSPYPIYGPNLGE